MGLVWHSTSIMYRKLLGCLIYGLSEKQTNPNEYLIGASVENASIWRVKPWPYCWQTQADNNYRKQKYKSSKWASWAYKSIWNQLFKQREWDLWENQPQQATVYAAVSLCGRDSLLALLVCAVSVVLRLSNCASDERINRSWLKAVNPHTGNYF